VSNKTIGEICNILSGYAFDSKLFTENPQDTPLIRIRDIVRGYTKTYTKESYDKKYVVKNGDLLIGMDGEFNIAPWKSEDALLNQRVCKIWCTSNEVIEKYLLYFLPKALKDIERETSFVTVKHLSVNTINKIQIPLPPFETQKKIANTLDAASELLVMHKQQIEELDNLIKSTFYDMFGDPITNEKGWEVKQLKKVCSKITDGTHHSPENSNEGQYRYITAKNIKKDGFDLSNVTYVAEEAHRGIFNRCNPEFEDILYIKDGVTTGIAQINTLNEEFSLLSSVALLKQNREVINAYYLRGVLNNETTYLNIRRNMGGAAITRLTLRKIETIRIPIPPISLQTQFAQIVTKIEEQKALVQKAIDETQYLFDSLMSQYFD
jgi:type I restriction enzyme S subunit